MKPAAQGWENATRIESAEESPASLVPDINDLVGRQLGNYVIQRVLARGGMAVVYLAKHPTLGREVAVKLLSPEYQGDSDLNRRFLQEARVTANFRHPNIVEIYDFGEIEGRAYYTMERLLGLDLASQLARKGRFSAREVADYLEQICAALSAAHEVGVVHRDLKPANIFVVGEEPLHVKLMDFGIAKVQEARSGSETRRGEVLGTPAYMSPEQALGNVHAISVRTDLYALGVIGYEMLTGQLPFVADSDLLLLTMQIRDSARPISELAPETPAAMAQLIERCLAKEPYERPASAEELARGLREACEANAPGALVPVPIAPGPARLIPERSAALESGVRRSAAPSESVAVEPAREALELAPAALEPALEEPEPTPAPAPAIAEPLPTPRPSSLLSEITDGPPGLLTLTSDDGKVLDKLLRRMQRRADFPAFLNNVTEISRRADADADYSAMQLSESILKDFALTAKLLRMVNGLFANRFGGRVYSVNQAVLILGFDSVRSMALGVSIYKQPGQGASGADKDKRQGRFHEQLADEAISSLISGEIARTLAPKAGIRDGELAMMCAMFRNLGQQLVMEYLPDEYAKILQLSEREGITRVAAAQRVLGTTLPKIGLGVAERWALPKLMRAAMAQNPRSDDALVRDEDRMSALARLSNDLCHIVATADRHNYKIDMQRLLATHKRLLSLSDQELSSLIGTVCKSFESRYSSLFGPYHKKSRFLFNARELTGEGQPVERRAAEPLTAESIARLEQGVLALADGLAKKRPLDVLLPEALQKLADVLDARRVLLLTQTGDRKELEVRLSVGEEAKALKSQFRVPLNQGADLFSSTLRSGKNLVVPDALGPATMRRLPQRYFEAIGSAAFALYVCASRGYPTALALVDAESAELLPAQERVSATRGLRELIAKLAEKR
jgi:serine/threonine protein kinase/HD-like signal output (HDOD) protein